MGITNVGTQNMNEVSFEEVKDFAISELWEIKHPITEKTAMAHDFSIAGQDGKDFMEAFSKKFGVSLEGFDWVEYFGPEVGANPFGLIVYLYKRFVQNIPARDLVDLPELTIEHLIACANKNKWSAPSVV